MSRPRKMRTGRLLAIAFALAVAVAVVGAGAVELFWLFPSRAAGEKGETHEIEIPSGASPRQIADILAQQGLVSSELRFALWLRLSRRMNGVRAGVYAVSEGLSPDEIANILSRRGLDRGVKVTIPEGFTLSKTGEALEAVGIIGSRDFVAAATDKGVLAALGIAGPTAEGYLFPDTYFFAPRASAREIMAKMHDVFLRRTEGLLPSDQKLRREVIVLASIVQAEARVQSEMPIIAAVYKNRLSSDEFPSRLMQADPTVAYGCEAFVTPRAASCDSFAGTLTRAQLDDPVNPYNTYKHPGLPPGPIGAPGLAAIRAALAPADVPYFYFVATGTDGRHTFSRTLEEHERAVSAYRKSR